MFGIVLYGMGFFLFTLLFQFLLNRFRKNHNKGSSTIWVGKSATVVICLMGIFTKDLNYFGAVIGFLIADEIGKQMDWQ